MREVASGIVASLLLAAACSKGQVPARPTSAQAKSATAPAGSVNACDRQLLTAEDAAASLGGPVARTEAIPGAPEACEFVTSGLAVMTVTLRPGLGRTTVAVWKSGRMPAAATTLAGVGDDAAWVADLHEVVAQQGDLLCDIQVAGVPTSARGSPSEEARRVGALCTKIFAAAR